MSAHAAVLFVNDAFYEAFRNRDQQTMEDLWARHGPVACIHPGWQALSTREEVMESWQAILANPNAPDIVCRGAEAFVLGEAAFVICYEVIGQDVLVATNVFVREAGDWKIAHHQAGPCNSPPSFPERQEPGPSALQ